MRLLNMLFLSVLLALLLVLVRVAAVQAELERWESTLEQRTHAAIARSELLRAANAGAAANVSPRSGELWLRVGSGAAAEGAGAPAIAYAFEAAASR